MAKGAGRVVAAWMLVVAALAVIAGAGLVTIAVRQGEAQVADLDESDSRAAQAAYVAAWGVLAVGHGLLLLLVATGTYLVSTIRTRRAALPRDRATRRIAVAGVVAIVGTLLFALVSPAGPVLTALGVASGGGGISNAVQLEEFNGSLTAASVGGQTNSEGAHVFRPVASAGAIQMRLVSETTAGNAGAIAILEAPDGAGWRELARTQPTGDSKVSVASGTYAEDLRIRVRLAEGTAGTVEYALFVSFDPA